MKFEVLQKALQKPLQLIAGVVERQGTLPVLSNLLLEVDNEGYLTLTATDQEVEFSDCIKVDQPVPGETTVPARKLVDICRNLPAGETIRAALEDTRLSICSGRFRSYLATLPAVEFPKAECERGNVSFNVQSEDLRKLLNKTSFAMALQDVRYFFNGLLLEVEPNELQAVATNGQRLALCRTSIGSQVEQQRVIVPRKGVVELLRLLADCDSGTDISISLSSNHLVAKVGKRLLTTKLIDATYPDYHRAIPVMGSTLFRADKKVLKQALSRTAILSNEMYRSIHLTLSGGNLNLRANNPQQEEAEENVSVDYQGEELQMAFNVGYLLDVLAVMDGEQVEFNLADTSGAVVLQAVGEDHAIYVVSPMVI